jgi:hypothetical protein
MKRWAKRLDDLGPVDLMGLSTYDVTEMIDGHLIAVISAFVKRLS